MICGKLDDRGIPNNIFQSSSTPYKCEIYNEV